MKYLVTIILVVIAIPVGAVLYAWTGWYNISATEPHWAVTKGYIEMLVENSIHNHSQTVPAVEEIPTDLDKSGVGHFHETCRMCHGAPGFSPNEFAAGLYPSPPDLAHSDLTQEFTASEVYWIVANGIKMTAMPAFSPTHDAEDLRHIVAFLYQLPDLTPDRYRRIAGRQGGHGASGGEASGQAEEAGHHRD